MSARHVHDEQTKRLAYDGHGTCLGAFCDECKTEFWSQWRPDILERYECDEEIEPEPGVIDESILDACMRLGQER